jgi:hypothetical protein
MIKEEGRTYAWSDIEDTKKEKCLNHVRFVVIDIFTIQVVLEQGSNTL